MEDFNDIESERLLIRILKLQDKEEFFCYRCLPEVFRYQGWRPLTIAEAEKFIIKNGEKLPGTPNTWLQLAICLKDGRLIGDIGVHFLEDGFQVEIGYTLSPTHQGNGYAYEAVKAVINYLFMILLKHRVVASVDPDNQKSSRLLEKLNFRKEAHFLKSFYNDGKWTDDCVYAILKEEWQ